MSFWTYMLHCADRSFYVGHTDDLDLRIAQHHDGTLGGYTATRRPVELVWSDQFSTRYEALSAERQIKGWGRAKKLALIRGDWNAISALARNSKEKGRASTGSARTELGEHHKHLPISVRPELVDGPFFLQPHSSNAIDQLELSVTTERTRDRLSFRYHLIDPLGQVLVPPATSPARANDLWRHTCFEAFLRRPGEASYAEFNFSPSTQWAAYRFDGYRAGMTDLDIRAPTIAVERCADRLVLTATFPPGHDDPLDANITTVIENSSGAKSYWALRHPPGPPDFHHPDCFALQLPAPEAP